MKTVIYDHGLWICSVTGNSCCIIIFKDEECKRKYLELREMVYGKVDRIHEKDSSLSWDDILEEL